MIPLHLALLLFFTGLRIIYAGPGIAKLKSHDTISIDYAAVWVGNNDNVNDELGPHIEHLLQNAKEKRRQTLRVDSITLDKVNFLLG